MFSSNLVLASLQSFPVTYRAMKRPFSTIFGDGSDGSDSDKQSESGEP